MRATAPAAEPKLEKAAELAHISVNTRHSSEHAWQQASAIALVSIARSLEGIATRLDSLAENSFLANTNGVPHATYN